MDITINFPIIISDYYKSDFQEKISPKYFKQKYDDIPLILIEELEV